MYARDVVEQLYLQSQQFIGTDVGGVDGNLLRESLTRFGLEENHTVVAGPLLGNVFDGHAVGNLVLGKQQYTFGARTHDEVDQSDESIDVALLVDDIFDERVNFTVDKRIEFEHVRVFTVPVGGLAFFQYLAEGREETVVPELVDKPFGLYQRHLFPFYTLGLGFAYATLVLGFDCGSLVELFLVVSARECVVAHEPFSVFESPHLDDAAQMLVGRNEEVDVVERFACKVFICLSYQAFGSIAIHLAQFGSPAARPVGKV